MPAGSWDRAAMFTAIETRMQAGDHHNIDELSRLVDLELRVLSIGRLCDPPRGNTVNRAPMGSDAKARPAPEIAFTHLMEGIGIALDLKGDRMFITDFGGNVLSAELDGSDTKVLLIAQGNLTAIAFSELS
jgi:hypothetical protein